MVWLGVGFGWDEVSFRVGFAALYIELLIEGVLSLNQRLK